ncbi:30S ribosomal protein S14 [Cellulomonas sp. HZM]|uniref:30S ribosomal protein S14 n=1 Tax=Cellulomonas sp. HZM TaxID=1454010 RepID=UPI000493AF8A|nr:30S ribosomal protein S14 [Cellulomonas sp. HZM]
MAKTSAVARDQRRRLLVARFATRRAELRRLAVDPAASPDARREARAALQRLPRDASPVRVRNRDATDGRPRGHLRVFGVSRITMRRLAHRGELPGVTKASW